MTSNRSRRVVALVALLTWSVVLGAAIPAAAGSSPTGDGSVQHSLDLGGTVDTVTGDADGTNASTEGDESGSNATETAESDNESVTRVVDETTTGLEKTVDELVRTRTPAQTDESEETSMDTPTPTPEPNPGPESDGGGIDRAVGETVETAAGESTPEETPAEADDDEDGSLVGTTADVVDGDGTGATEPVDETVTGTTDAVQETTNTTGRSVGNTTNGTGGAVDEIARTATGNESEPAETVGSTTRNAEETVRTVESTTDEVANATGETGPSSGSTGDFVADAAAGVTRTVDATAAGTVDSTSAVTTTVDETVSSTTGLFDGGNGTVARLAGNVTSGVDTATGGLTAVVDDTVDGGVTGGLFEPDGDGENAEAYGWPTEESGASIGDGTVASGEGARAEATDSADPAKIASTQASSSEAPDDGPKADDTASSDGGGVLPSLDEVDPAAGGAIAGALLVSGSVLATRAGMTASSMGAGAATLPQLLFAMLREFVLRLAALAGYSRYDFSDPLENENRATVLETVEASPGINLTSLVEETGLTQSTVRYHARVLEHEGLLDAAKVRGRRRFVPQANEDVELVAAFEEEATRDVIDALFEHEPATGTTLAEALDRDPSTVSHHLSRLSEAGLVEREQDGPALRNSLSAEVRAALSDLEVTASVQQHVRADD